MLLYMNRREFTASLGALSGAATLPLSVVPAAAAATPAVPSATYAWAKLILQAQAKADPAFMARYLKLQPDVAQSLFKTLIHDGVLRTKGLAGVAHAVELLSAGTQRPSIKTAHHQMQKVWAQVSPDTQPLVKEERTTLECGDTARKESANARTPEPVQESPRRG